MNTIQLKHPMLCHGPGSHRYVYIKFTPNGTNAPSVEESHGFSSTVSYTSAGIYVATVGNIAHIKDIAVVGFSLVPGDANYHELTYALSVTNRTITVTHKTCTYATIVSAGPAVSNTAGQITLACLVRTSS